jgi:hypothetical protein
MVELLLEYGARPDDQHGLPMRIAEEYADADMVELLQYL